MPKAATKSTSERLLEEQAEKREAAEAILTQAAEEGRKLTLAEREFLRVNLSWNEPTQERERLRRLRAYELQLIYGTSEDREKLAAHVAATANRLKEEGPKIDEQIAQLQADRSKLEREAESAARRQRDVEQALQAVEDLAPTWIKQECQERWEFINSTLGDDYRSFESQVHIYECLIDPGRFASKRDHIYCIKRYDSSLAKDIVHGEGAGKRVVDCDYSEAWEKERARIESELPSLRKDRDNLKERLEAAKAEIQKALRVYWL